MSRPEVAVPTLHAEPGPKQPIHFGAPSRPLFGFFHPPSPRAEHLERKAAVLVAAPIGTDLTRSDRTLRHLCERLASAGFACLRYDPFGTGDSGGDEREPELVEAWLEDLGIAADELRARSGRKTIAVVGLRLGATLAAIQAADRGDVDALVLWSPCVTGAAYVTEATRLHKLYARIEASIADAPPPRAEGQEALGMVIPAALAAGLGALDLTALAKRPAPRALFVDGGNVARRDEMLARLAAVGTQVDLRSYPGHKFLVTASHRSVLPSEILDAIVAWLADAYAPAPALAPEPRPAPPGPAGERPLVLRPVRGPLFALLTPADPAKADPSRAALVLANAGCVNRSGPHRLATRMARAWAALGHDVLRVDLSGIGDSPVAHGARENLTYPPDGIGDLSAAVDFFGDRPVVVVGLCSGGDYAFQLGATRELAGAWILNPRTFCVLDLAAVESGDGDAPQTPVGEVPATLRAMGARGVDTLLVVSPNDPGTAYVDAHAGDAMRALEGAPGFRRVEVPHADHTFTPASAQEALLDALTAHLVGLAKPRARMSAAVPASRPRNAR